MFLACIYPNKHINSRLGGEKYSQTCVKRSPFGKVLLKVTTGLMEVKTIKNRSEEIKTHVYDKTVNVRFKVENFAE